MAKTLRIELPDEIFDAIQALAVRSGRPVEELAVEWLARYRRASEQRLPAPELEQARQRFRRHFGVVRSGQPSAANNEQIDADLARELGNPHETES